MLRIAAPVVLTVLVIFSGAILGKRASSLSKADIRYMEALAWFMGHESDAINDWLDVQELARAQKTADLLLADRIDNEIAPFWREASERFDPLQLEPNSKHFDSHQFMRKAANGRSHAMSLCSSGLRAHDPKIVQECMEEMGKVDLLIAERTKVLEAQH